jgi:hypothetical protein
VNHVHKHLLAEQQPVRRELARPDGRCRICHCLFQGASRINRKDEKNKRREIG